MPFETVPFLHGRYLLYHSYFVLLGVVGQGFWALMSVVFAACLRCRENRFARRTLIQEAVLVESLPVIHEGSFEDRRDSEDHLPPTHLSIEEEQSFSWLPSFHRCLAVLVYVLFIVGGPLTAVACEGSGLGDFTFLIPTILVLVLLAPSAIAVGCFPQAFAGATSIFLAIALFQLAGVIAIFTWFNYLNVFIAWLLAGVCIILCFRVAKTSGRPGTRWWCFVALGSFALAGLMSIALMDVCLSLYTLDSHGTISSVLDTAFLSTQWSRPRHACSQNSDDSLMPCHVYLTLAEDASSSVFINIHMPLRPHGDDVRVYTLCESNQEDCWNPRYAAFGVRFDHSYLKAGDRQVHSAFIQGLSAGTDYRIVIEVAGKNLSSLPHWRFRTAPSEGENVELVFGGDMGSSTSVSHLMGIGVASEWHGTPAAVVVGGDVAYDNGMASCWCVWEDWLDRWDDAMVRARQLVPLVLAVGNHDVGVEAIENVAPPQVDKKILPFFTFFPQHSIEQDVPQLAKRRSYHSHRIGDALVLCLDSGYVVQADAKSNQLAWANHVIEVEARPGRTVFPTYHVPVYPSVSKHHEEWGAGPSSAFVGLFDTHDVRIAFENHVHAFKRTVPMRKHEIRQNGTVYLGDGRAGLHGLGVPKQSALLSRSDESRLQVDSLAREHVFRLQAKKDGNTVKAIDPNGEVFDFFEQNF